MLPHERTDPVQDTQDAYERIRSWLSRPGATKCATDDGSTCLYKDGRGNHCAIGGPMKHILTEEETSRNPDVASLLSEDSSHYNDDAYVFWAKANLEFLSLAQDAHDYADTEDFQESALESLDALAFDFGLKVVKS